MSSLRRIWAMVMRYWYLLRRSVPRIIDMISWPVVDVVLWGFLSQFLAGNSTFIAKASGVLLAGMFLWDVMSRSQLGVSVGLLEEVWARHLGHIFVSPLRAWEWLAALMAMSIFRMVAGLAPAVLVAMALYHFSLFDLGLPLAGFVACLLMMGWWLGILVVAAILRWGQGAENLAWAAPFVLSPLGAVYYPVSTLPYWLKPVALAMPAAHVFEGMRGVMVDHMFQFTRDYRDPDKRSIANGLTVELTDGTRLNEVVVEYPVGHKRRRAEGWPLLEAKFRRNLARRYPQDQQHRILQASADRARLEAMAVTDYVDLYAAPGV